MLDVRRRGFLGLLCGAAAWPLAARAQQPGKLPVVGFLNQAAPDTAADRVRAFRRGLSETGYVEGQNMAIEYRWAEDHVDRLPAMAADLVRRQVVVIAAFGVPAALAAKVATKTTSIVVSGGFDPVAVGLAASLNRPGGNLTGVSQLGIELGPKHLQLLHELVPTATIVAQLVNPTNPSAEPQSREFQAVARTLGLEAHILRASTVGDFDTVFADLARLRAGGLVIGSDALLINRSEQLAALTVRHAVPTISPYLEFSAAGGLASYGSNIADAYRLTGIYAGRILKGEKAADLPVQQATKIELVINMKTAKALGITVPLPLLGRADEVIE